MTLKEVHYVPEGVTLHSMSEIMPVVGSLDPFQGDILCTSDYTLVSYDIILAFIEWKQVKVTLEACLQTVDKVDKNHLAVIRLYVTPFKDPI